MSTITLNKPLLGEYVPEEWSYVNKEDNEQKNTVAAVIGENIIVPTYNERKTLQWKLVEEDTDSVIYLNKGENIIQRCQLEPCTREEAYKEYIKIICDEEKDYLVIEPLENNFILSHVMDKGKIYKMFIREMDLIAIKGNVDVKHVQSDSKEIEGMILQFFAKEKEAEIQWICEVGECSKIVAEEYILTGKKSDKYWRAVSYFKEETIKEELGATEEIGIAEELGVIDDDCGW